MPELNEARILSETERQEALARVKEQPRRGRNGYVCIGGIGRHGECYGHYPSADCPYCITPDKLEQARE